MKKLIILLGLILLISTGCTDQDKYDHSSDKDDAIENIDDDSNSDEIKDKDDDGYEDEDDSDERGSDAEENENEKDNADF